MPGVRSRRYDRVDNSALSRGGFESLGGVQEEETLTVTAAKSSACYSYLNLALLRGPEGAFFDAEVLGPLEHDGLLGTEGYGRHV